MSDDAYNYLPYRKWERVGLAFLQLGSGPTLSVWESVVSGRKDGLTRASGVSPE